MTEDLKDLIKAAREVTPSPEQNEAQRLSFAFGNTNIENPRITRETIKEEAEKLNRK